MRVRSSTSKRPLLPVAVAEVVVWFQFIFPLTCCQAAAEQLDEERGTSATDISPPRLYSVFGQLLLIILTERKIPPTTGKRTCL